MMMAVQPEKYDALMRELKEAGIGAACIGRAVMQGEGTDIAAPTADELFKVIHRK